MMIKTSSAK